MQATGGHAWYVHEGHTESNGTCSDHLGAQYNPYRVNTTAESGYLDDCSSLRQQRCAMGDLGGKQGTLRLEPMANSPHKTYSFYDENLDVLGPFSSESIYKPAVVPTATCKCPWLDLLHICCTYTLCSLICHSFLPSSSVLGHSIVVYGSGNQSGQVLGCANIEPSLVAEGEIEISFPQNGTDPGNVDRCLLNYLHS